jgi:hypothetical protein
MVEIFKTDVQETLKRDHLLERLRSEIIDCKINFDLEDCDRILRVEGQQIAISKVLELMKKEGHFCELLVS